MNRPLLFKLTTVALLILLLLIPISMISGVITDRKSLRENVVAEIAKSSSYSQKLVGPVLVVPYSKKVKEWKLDAASKSYQEETVQMGQLYFLPSAFSVDGEIKTERRSRGIYAARLYRADNQISGHFSLPKDYGISDDLESYTFEAPYVAVGVNDIRGIIKPPQLKINDDMIDMSPGTKLKILGEGVHAIINSPDVSEKTTIHFYLNLILQGTEHLTIVPIGHESTVVMKSGWPHPSFIGSYLPVEHSISETGFTATWENSYFSSNMEEDFNSCARHQNCDAFQGRYFGVSLIDPVDQYVKSDRAIKYALLFIALTFAGFFLFEILKRLAVHPVQYGLVGLALAFFYLLLVSLSEHIAFSQAYLISSSACILLIGFYVSFVLKSVVRGAGFSALLAALYGLLYGLLSAEDYALLMGSLLLFGLLGVFMILTRKLDWYAVGKSEKAAD